MIDRASLRSAQEEIGLALPEPLTSSDCNLRGYEWLRSSVADVLDGDLGRLPDEAFRGAMMAMHAAWHQVPAASLPDDDATLAHLLRYGRDVGGWQRARQAGALVGWVKCSDGRLYHPELAAQANEAWQQRKFYQERAVRGAAARWAKAAQGNADDALACDAAPSVPDDASSMLKGSFKDARREEREQIGEGKKERARVPAFGRNGPAQRTSDIDSDIEDLTVTLRREGVQRLSRLLGTNYATSAVFYDQLLRDSGWNDHGFAEVLKRTESAAPDDPRAYLITAARNLAEGRTPGRRQPWAKAA